LERRNLRKGQEPGERGKKKERTRPEGRSASFEKESLIGPHLPNKKTPSERPDFDEGGEKKSSVRKKNSRKRGTKEKRGDEF